MKKKHFKFLVVSIVMALLFTSLSGIGVAKKAEQQQEKEIKKMAKQLEFLWEKAAIKDESGNIIGFDIDKVERKYGKSDDLIVFNMLNDTPNFVISESDPIPSGDFSILRTKEQTHACVNKKLKDYFGSILAPATYGAIFQLLWEGNYTDAAKKLLKIGVKGNIFGIVGSLAHIRWVCR